MKYVGVRHHDDQTKVFWFSVPELFENDVQIGTLVTCDTRKGKTGGVVCEILDGISQSDAEKIIGNRFPLKPIVSLEKLVQMSDIYIPFEMAMSSPSPDKIKQRIEEYYRTGVFKTKVELTVDNQLKDGYTAYLVARMFNHSAIKASYTAEGDS